MVPARVGDFDDSSARPEKCNNIVEFYYPEEIALFEPEFIEAEQKAYEETAMEDEEICQRMNDGRRLLWQEVATNRGRISPPWRTAWCTFTSFFGASLLAFDSAPRARVGRVPCSESSHTHSYAPAPRAEPAPLASRSLASHFFAIALKPPAANLDDFILDARSRRAVCDDGRDGQIAG